MSSLPIVAELENSHLISKKHRSTGSDEIRIHCTNIWRVNDIKAAKPFSGGRPSFGVFRIYYSVLGIKKIGDRFHLSFLLWFVENPIVFSTTPAV